MKRNRGRRGLDILNRMQKSKITVEIMELDAPETREVDEKLLIIGKQYGAKIITNDFNLNKVAEIHGVPVLNINDLANALKPAVLPGELLTIRVIKEGKESGQGIGYLDDGTKVTFLPPEDLIDQSSLWRMRHQVRQNVPVHLLHRILPRWIRLRRLPVPAAARGESRFSASRLFRWRRPAA